MKWTAERSESFMSDAHGRDHVTHVELALDDDGKFTALKVSTVANMGAYLSTFATCVPTYLYGTLLAGTYTTPAVYVETKAVFTNTVPVDAYRGAGRPEATFLLERIVDLAADELGIDPAELRRQATSSRPTPSRTRRRWRCNTTAATTRRPCKWRCEAADYAGFERAPAGGRERGANTAASASPPISRPAASRRRRWSARSAPAPACSSRRRCGCIRPAASPC